MDDHAKILESMRETVQAFRQVDGVQAVVLIIQFDGMAVVESGSSGGGREEGKNLVRSLVTEVAKQIRENDPIERGAKPQ